MSKLHRTSAPPAGYGVPLRNTRLYGDREEQISTAALRARGCPNPDRAVVVKPRRVLRDERAERRARETLQRAQTAMLEAQRAVRAARLAGDEDERARLAVLARRARAEYLRLSGGVEGHVVTAVAEHADRGW